MAVVVDKEHIAALAKSYDLVGLLKYIQVHMGISLSSLIALLCTFVVLNTTNPFLFLAIDFFILTSILSGIFPIITSALIGGPILGTGINIDPTTGKEKDSDGVELVLSFPS